MHFVSIGNIINNLNVGIHYICIANKTDVLSAIIYTTTRCDTLKEGLCDYHTLLPFVLSWLSFLYIAMT